MDISFMNLKLKDLNKKLEGSKDYFAVYLPKPFENDIGWKGYKQRKYLHPCIRKAFVESGLFC